MGEAVVKQIAENQNSNSISEISNRPKTYIIWFFNSYYFDISDGLSFNELTIYFWVKRLFFIYHLILFFLS